MKKTKRIPELKTEEDVHRFWSTHSLTDYLDDTEAVDVVIELSPALAKKIQERSRKRLLTIRLEEWRIARAKEIARAKGVPYQQLLREWISRGLSTDRTRPKPKKRRAQ
jgi:predicted DNA binding CopG/RHH family protein